MEKTKGFYIVFEGVDGAGKTTMIERTRKWLSEKFEVMITKEPGGSPIGKKVREIVLHTTSSGPLTDVLLFMVDRSEKISRILIPNKENGIITLSDRNYVSSLVYQGFMKGFENRILKLHKDCDLNYDPDLLIIFDIDPEMSMSRMSKGDKFEIHDLEYFQKVRKHYKEDIPKLISDDCQVRILDANLEEDEVFKNIQKIISDMILTKGLKF